MPDPTLAVGPFVNLDPTDYPYCVSLSRDLFYGAKDSSTGGEVSAIQSYLTDRGFLETGATGFYGRATEVGVKRFQYRNELSVTGNVTVETRDILKELTCVKYPRVTYVDKPLSPGKIYTKTTTKTVITTKKATVIPTTKAATPQTSTTPYTSVTPSTNSNTVIPPTTTQTPAPTNSSGPTLNNSKLSSIGGTISLSKGNSLFFTFSSNSSSPSMCINLGSLDCSKSSNYSSVSVGVNGSFYEATDISGKWAFTIYGNRSWGSSGNKVNIFLKDSPTSNTISVYTVVVAN
jgi:peptidoglycan hydrolase-like protein with peptidoglycan-binding domain